MGFNHRQVENWDRTDRTDRKLGSHLLRGALSINGPFAIVIWNYQRVPPVDWGPGWGWKWSWWCLSKNWESWSRMAQVHVCASAQWLLASVWPYQGFESAPNHLIFNEKNPMQGIKKKTKHTAAYLNEPNYHHQLINWSEPATTGIWLAFSPRCNLICYFLQCWQWTILNFTISRR